MDAAEAREPRPKVGVRAWGAGERARISPLPRARSRQPGRRPVPAARSPPPPSTLLPPPSPESGVPGPAEATAHPAGSAWQSAEGLRSSVTRWPSPGTPRALEGGPVCPRLWAKGSRTGVLTPSGSCHRAFQNLGENWFISLGKTAFTQTQGEPRKDPTPTSGPRTDTLGLCGVGPAQSPSGIPPPIFWEGWPRPRGHGRDSCYLRDEGQGRSAPPPGSGSPVALSVAAARQWTPSSSEVGPELL